MDLFPTTLLLLGAALLVAGLVGSVKAKEIEIGASSAVVRTVLGFVGAAFIGLSLLMSGGFDVISFLAKNNKSEISQPEVNEESVAERLTDKNPQREAEAELERLIEELREKEAELERIAEEARQQEAAVEQARLLEENLRNEAEAEEERLAEEIRRREAEAELERLTAELSEKEAELERITEEARRQEAAVEQAKLAQEQAEIDARDAIQAVNTAKYIVTVTYNRNASNAGKSVAREVAQALSLLNFESRSRRYFFSKPANGLISDVSILAHKDDWAASQVVEHAIRKLGIKVSELTISTRINGNRIETDSSSYSFAVKSESIIVLIPDNYKAPSH